jgi:hypothetical protein
VSVSVPVIQQAKIQAEVLVPLIKALQAELGEERANALVRRALGDTYRFRTWFEAFDAEQFDAAIERDIGAGKLDAHADEALAAHRAGRSRDL